VRVVTVYFGSIADGRALLIDRDTTLTSATAQSTAIISTDPAATIANQITSPTTGIGNQLICALGVGTADKSVTQIFIDFPLSAGEVIYLSKSVIGTIQLFFTDK
jgi:hypothetical protein